MGVVKIMTEFLTSVLEGLLQGLTEYLPVSSSAHLSIFQYVTGGAEQGLAFELVLHLATVCATLVYFCKDIIALLVEFFQGFAARQGEKGEGWYFGWAVLFGSVPTAIIGLLLEPFVKNAVESMRCIGAALIVTSLILLSLKFISMGKRKICISIGIIVGIAQGFAVIPGISRSGLTLAAALLCGLSAAEAFRFSFLLSLPAVVGASLLEFSHAGAFSALPAGWFAGACAAFISGLGALALFRRTVIRGRWVIFSLYCALVGLFALFIL